MDRMSDYDIWPKPKVSTGSPNECRTFSRMVNVVVWYERLLQVTGECIEWPGDVVVSIKYARERTCIVWHEKLGLRRKTSVYHQKYLRRAWLNRGNRNQFQIRFCEIACSTCELSEFYGHWYASITLHWLCEHLYTPASHVLLTSDYCNTVLAGSPMSTNRLQHLLNAIARVVSST